MNQTSNGELDVNRAIDLDKLEAEIQVETIKAPVMKSPVYYAEPVNPPRMPVGGPNLQQLPSVTFTGESTGAKIGKLTAEAVLRDYEATAEAITAMGAELARTVKRCEEYMGMLQAMIKDVNAVADSYRTKGADIFRQIEDSAQMTESIRRTATDMASKISTKLEI